MLGTRPRPPRPRFTDDDAKPSTEHQTQETETESQTPEKESQTPEKESQAPEGRRRLTFRPRLETLTPTQIAELVKRNKAAQEIIHRQAQSMKDKELARIQREQE